VWLLARRRGVGCDLEELECEAKRAANPEFEQRICGLVKSISQEIGPLKQQEFARKRGRWRMLWSNLESSWPHGGPRRNGNLLPGVSIQPADGKRLSASVAGN